MPLGFRIAWMLGAGRKRCDKRPPKSTLFLMSFHPQTHTHTHTHTRVRVLPAPSLTLLSSSSLSRESRDRSATGGEAGGNGEGLPGLAVVAGGRPPPKQHPWRRTVPTFVTAYPFEQTAHTLHAKTATLSSVTHNQHHNARLCLLSLEPTLTPQLSRSHPRQSLSL